VLIVDDDPSSVRLIARQIHSSGRTYEVQRAYRAVDALRRLREGEIDVILLDLLMPDMGGRELLAVLQEDEELAGIPVIVLTAQEPQSAGARTPPGQLIAVSQAQGISNEEALVYLQGLLQTLLSRELLVASLAT
jgi:CheY-like chemotaxis protein